MAVTNLVRATGSNTRRTEDCTLRQCTLYCALSQGSRCKQVIGCVVLKWEKFRVFLVQKYLCIQLCCGLLKVEKNDAFSRLLLVM